MGRKTAAILISCLAVTACTDTFEDEAQNASRTISVSISQTTRTCLGQGEKANSILWSLNDRVAILDGNLNRENAAIGLEYIGTSDARFVVGDGMMPEYTVIYPSSAVHDGLTLSLPSSQEYVEGSFANNIAVLAGRGENVITLHSLSSFVKVSVDSDVSSMVFSANSGEIVAGEYSISDDAERLTAKAGSSSLHIDCTKVGGARDFIIAVPSGWYHTGFTIRMKGVGSTTYRYATAYSKGKELAGGVMYLMPELQLASCPESSQTVITTPSELQEFLSAGNGNGEFGCDMDLDGVTIVPCSEFSGTLDGLGFSIRNWHTETPLITSIKSSGKVRNIVIDRSCSLNVTQSLKYFGFVAGNVYGTVTGCINHADISCTTPQTKVSIQHIGGAICGNTYSGSMLSECVNDGNVTFTFYNCDESTGKNQYIGGITGIINATSTAVRIRNCVNRGNVTVYVNMAGIASSKNISVGGIVSASGANGGSSTTTTGFTKNYGIIEGCVNYGDISEYSPNGSTGGYHLVGGITGYTEGSIRSCTNYGKVTLAGSETVTSSSPKVGGVAGFVSMECSNCENHGEINVSGLFGNAKYTYSTGVGGCYWASVGGVVGQIGDGEVKTTTFITSCRNYGSITALNGMATANGSGNSCGGVCAMAFGNVDDCHNSGNISVATNDYSVRCGGVVGHAYSTVSGSTNGSTIDFTYDCSANTKEGTSAQYVGGICGNMMGPTVEACRNDGTITARTRQGTTQAAQLLLGGVTGYTANAQTTISGSYNHGSISASGETSQSKASGIGGVCGRVKESPSYIRDSGNDASMEVSVEGLTQTGGIVGYMAGTVSSCSSKGSISVRKAVQNSAAGGVAGTMVASDSSALSDIVHSGTIAMTQCSEGTSLGAAFGSISGQATMTDVTLNSVLTAGQETHSGFIAGRWHDTTADYTIGAAGAPVMLLSATNNGTVAPTTPTIATMVGDWQSIVPTASSGGMTFVSYSAAERGKEVMLRMDDIEVEEGGKGTLRIQYRYAEDENWKEYDTSSNPLGLGFTSSNTTILTVAPDGSMSGIAEGSAVVKARTPDRLGTCVASAKVVVYEVEISSMELDRIIVSKFAKLPGNSVMQSFDIDEDWNIFYTQTYGGNKIYISKGRTNNDSTGDYATLWFHGHGTNTCIESIGSDRYIWCCNFGSKDSEGAYNSEQVVSRFRYANGLSLYSWEQTENYYMGPPARTFGPVAIDHKNDLVAFYHMSTEESGRIVTMYRLSEIKALTPEQVTLAKLKFGGEATCPQYPEQTATPTIMAKKVSNLTPYARFKMPTLLQSMQGFDIHEGRCYILSGAGGNNDGTPGTAYLSVCDYTGKVLMNSSPIKAISDVHLLEQYGITESGYMESEGCKVIGGKLYIGFASKSVNDGNRRRANIFKYRLPKL